MITSTTIISTRVKPAAEAGLSGPGSRKETVPISPKGDPAYVPALLKTLGHPISRLHFTI